MVEYRFDRLSPHVKVRALKLLRERVLSDIESSAQVELYNQIPVSMQTAVLEKRLHVYIVNCKFTEEGEILSHWKPPLIDPERQRGVFE